MISLTGQFSIGYKRHSPVACLAGDFQAGCPVCVIRGPNGCGKTTFLRTVARILPPIEDGDGVVSRFHEGAIAYLPDRLTFHEQLSAKQVLKQAHGLDGAGLELAELMGMDLDKPVAELSHGNRAKLAVAWTVGHPAVIYLLDEPFNGMDDQTMRKFFDAIPRLRPRAMFWIALHGAEWVDQKAERVQFNRLPSDGKAMYGIGMEKAKP